MRKTAILLISVTWTAGITAAVRWGERALAPRVAPPVPPAVSAVATADVPAVLLPPAVLLAPAACGSALALAADPGADLLLPAARPAAVVALPLAPRSP